MLKVSTMKGFKRKADQSFAKASNVYNSKSMLRAFVRRTRGPHQAARRASSLSWLRMWANHSSFFKNRVSLPLWDLRTATRWKYFSQCAPMTVCLPDLHGLVYIDTWLVHPVVSPAHLCIPRTTLMVAELTFVEWVSFSEFFPHLGEWGRFLRTKNVLYPFRPLKVSLFRTTLALSKGTGTHLVYETSCVGKQYDSFVSY